jgi:ketosteroid isomerase-like protein
MSDVPIERFFETYAERYMASDADAIAAMYEVPFLAVREGRAIHLGDPAAVREHLVALMEAYRNAGATKATIAELQVTQLDRTSAIATVRWNALSGDGALLRDFATSYQMLREEPRGWRILSYTYHDD